MDAHGSRHVIRLKASLKSGSADLHRELMARLHDRKGARVDGSLYATAYRPVGHNGRSNLQIWANALQLESTLPSMPLWLRGGPCVPVELDAAYERTCLEHRIG